MKNIVKMLFVAMATVAVAAGCQTAVDTDGGCDGCTPNVGCGGACTPTASAKTSSVTYLCVGMEVSDRFGSCPGAGIDAKRINSLFHDKYGYSGKILVASEATSANVRRAMADGIAKTPEDGLFIMFYSGHGGQEDLSGTGIVTSEPEGADSMDEYLCLYDTYMLDDDVWNLISKCKGRVLLVFDCCHSATMWRSVRSMTLKDGRARALTDKMVKSSGFTMGNKARALSVESKFCMMSWSGCTETTYSYGGSSGGVMTSAIVSYWTPNKTYDELWSEVVKRVEAEQPTQHPVRTVIGGGFSCIAFR